MTSIVNLKKILTFCLIFLALAMQAQERFGGLALYTVRDDMSKDPNATLKAVADAGYAYVEAAGYQDGKYYGMEPADFKKALSRWAWSP